MHYDSASLAALIGSRICHDLISPIGAISNGLELVGLGGATIGSPEMSLIQQSCDNAAARIRFFRIAFGSAGEIRPVSSDEARQTLANHYADTRFATRWKPDVPFGRDVTQLAYLGALCLETALPRGGTLSVDVDGGVLIIAAVGEVVRTATPLWRILTDGDDRPIAEVRPADVQFTLLARLCKDAGCRPTLLAAHSEARLEIPLQFD